MIIKPKNSELNQFVLQCIDHFIATILSFPLSFLVIFYLSLKTEVKFNFNCLTFLFANISIYIYLCLGITLIANFIVVLINYKNYSVREFNFFDKKDVFIIRYKMGYSNRNYFIEVSENTVDFVRVNKTGILGESNRILKIFCNGNRVLILNLDDFIWCGDSDTIGELLNIIKQLKTANYSK